MTSKSAWVIPDIALSGPSEQSEAALLREEFERRAMAGMRGVTVKILCHSFPLAECKATEIRADGVVIPCLPRALPSRAFLQVEFEVGNPAAAPHRMRFPVFIESSLGGQTVLRFTFVDDSRAFLDKGIESLRRSTAGVVPHRERELNGFATASFNL
ncbi:MAG: hypothetical protein ACFCUJ_06465 [Thiotrichales bacterium]